jgi:hypothetical protein
MGVDGIAVFRPVAIAHTLVIHVPLWLVGILTLRHDSIKQRKGDRS